MTCRFDADGAPTIHNDRPAAGSTPLIEPARTEPTRYQIGTSDPHASSGQRCGPAIEVLQTGDATMEEPSGAPANHLRVVVQLEELPQPLIGGCRCTCPTWITRQQRATHRNGQRLIRAGCVPWRGGASAWPAITDRGRIEQAARVGRLTRDHRRSGRYFPG